MFYASPMIDRVISPHIKKAAKGFPIIGILGPRQSGKTTLAKKIFPAYQYVNLELPESRRFAQQDPQKFLSQYSQYTIIDEAQRVPELFSYLQVKTDEDKIKGQYILTGSQHFLMLSSLTQSLAGRIALFNLYPLSYEELVKNSRKKFLINDLIFQGGYPQLCAEKLDNNLWFNSYLQTYLERDISQLSQINNLPVFEKFIRLAAGRTGQLLNLSSLSADVGVSHNTIKTWINLLEISGLVTLLQPYYANLNKRLIKTPKLYFTDTGLVCYLLGINRQNQLDTHPLYGQLFETYIISEYLKFFANHQINSLMYFFRNRQGLEADLLLDQGLTISLNEIKSAHTIPLYPFNNLLKIKTLLPKPARLNLIYGGSETQTRTLGKIISWQNLTENLLTR